MTHHRIAPLLFVLLLLAPLSLIAKTPLKIVAFSAQELSSLKGHYSSVEGYVYIQVNGKDVSTVIDGKWIQLYKKSDGHIYPKYKLLKIFPISLGDMSFSLQSKKGQQQIVMHSKKGKGKGKVTKTTIVAQKFTPKSIPKYWQNKLGKYKATVLKGKSGINKIRLAVKRGVLVAYINKLNNPYPLLALSASKLYSPSAGHNQAQPIYISSLANKITLKYGKNSLVLNKL